MQGERDPLPYNLPTSEREDSRVDPDCSDGDVDEDLKYDLELMDICNDGEQSDVDVDFDSFSDSELDEVEKEYEVRRMNALNVSISDVSDLSEWVKSQQLEWSQLVQQYITKNSDGLGTQVQKRLQDQEPGRNE